MSRRGPLAVALAALGVGAPAAAATTMKPLRVQWMGGYRSPGTPDRFNRVGVIKVGLARAQNVLVLEPGTSP